MYGYNGQDFTAVKRKFQRLQVYKHILIDQTV